MTDLPTHEAADLDGAVEAIRRHGTALVRAALPADVVARAVDNVAAVHSLLDDLAGRATRDGFGNFDPIMRAALHVHVRQTGFPLSLPFHLRLDGLVALLDVQLAARASPLFVLAERLFGERPAILVDRCSARRQDPVGNRPGLGWHQDVGALGIERPEERGLTCWIPLVAIDAATPALEVRPGRVAAVLAHVNDVNEYAVLAADPTTGGPAEGFWSSRGMVPGDALVFDARTIHRTAVEAGQSKPRHSIDLRMRPLSEAVAIEGALLA